MVEIRVPFDTAPPAKDSQVLEIAKQFSIREGCATDKSFIFETDFPKDAERFVEAVKRIGVYAEIVEGA